MWCGRYLKHFHKDFSQLGCHYFGRVNVVPTIWWVLAHAIRKSLTSIAESVTISEIVWRFLLEYSMVAISE